MKATTRTALKKAVIALGILVLAIFAGAFIRIGVLLASPLGMVVLGWCALFCLSFARALWSRHESRSFAVALALSIAMLAALACVLLAGLLHRVLIGLLAGLVVGLYLLRRKRAKKPAGPLMGARLGAAATVVGLIIGIVPGAWFTMDEKPRHFPHLQMELAAVAPEENAYVSLKAMINNFDLATDDELRTLMLDPPTGMEWGSPEWRAKAEEVVHRWGGCLSEMDRMLAKPHFQPPTPTPYVEVAGTVDEAIWLGYCRDLRDLTMIQSGLHLGSGDVEEAMTAAKKAIVLGLMISRGGNGAIAYLAGAAIVGQGLERVRRIALLPHAPRHELETAAALQEIEDGMKEALVNTLRAEHHRMRLILQQLDRLEALEADDEMQARVLRLGRVLFRHAPGLKLNSTLNTAGAWMEEVINGLDAYRPAPTVEEVYGPGKAGELGAAHYRTWNPIGDILVMMQIPAWGRMVDDYYRALADMRMTLLFMAMRSYYSDNRRLPDSLEDLVPKYLDHVHADPFTGEAIRYEPHTHPPRAYSVGPDQKPDDPAAEEGDDLSVGFSFAAP